MKLLDIIITLEFEDGEYTTEELKKKATELSKLLDPEEDSPYPPCFNRIMPTGLFPIGWRYETTIRESKW